MVSTISSVEHQSDVSPSLEYNYEWFNHYSNQLDRNTEKLQEDAFTRIRDIKKRLHIKEFNQVIKYGNIQKKTKTFQRKENNVIHEIYKILNKITEKTYEKLSEELIIIIDNLMENHSSQKDEVCKKFFEIISNIKN